MPAVLSCSPGSLDLVQSLLSVTRGFSTSPAINRVARWPSQHPLCPPYPIPVVCDERDLTCLRTPVQLAPVCGPILAPPAAEGPALEAGGSGTDGPGTVAGVPAAAPAGSGGSSPVPTAPPPGGSGTDVGAIVGGVVGGVAGLAVGVGLLALLAARRRRQAREQQRRSELARASDVKPSARPFISEVGRAYGRDNRAPARLHQPVLLGSKYDAASRQRFHREDARQPERCDQA